MERQSPMLIAYDGSENAQHAITQMRQLVDRERPTIVLHAWTPVGATDEETIAEGVALEGAQLAREAGFDAKAETIRAVAPTWETIVNAADELGASLIVLGSRGLRSVRTLILGSVAHQVVHHAHHPVLVIPSDELVEVRRTLARERRDAEPTS